MRMNRFYCLVGISVTAACGVQNTDKESHVSSVYDRIANYIFSRLLPGSFSGTQGDLSDNRECGLRIVERPGQRPRFEFNYVNPRTGEVENEVLDGEKLSGTTGYSLMNTALFGKVFHVVLDDAKQRPVRYIVKNIISNIPCHLVSESEPDSNK